MRLEHDEMIRVHIRFQIGKPFRVFEDVKPDLIALNLYPVPPRVDRPWWTIVTSGLSSAPMRVREPGRPEKLAHAELCMLLPQDWPLGDPAADEDHWPLSLLGDLARLPHAHDTWLGPGHVVANGATPEPYSSTTRFAGAIVLPPRLPGPGFSRFRANKRVTIEFLAVVPLLPDEIVLAREVGGCELATTLARHGVTEVLDPDRESVASIRAG
jgi:Suppressor of fused protein (SUFU)